MCFAFDNKHEGNKQAMMQLADITRQFNAELHVLNAQSDVMNRDNIPDIDEGVKRLLESLNPTYHILYDIDIDDAVDNSRKRTASTGWVYYPANILFSKDFP